jgi:hypothetical protein
MNGMLERLTYQSVRFAKKNAPTILTCLGAAGVIATSVLTAKATMKASKLLEEAEYKKGDELTTSETIKVAGPSYIPAVLVGVSTITCIFGANVLNKRNQAALASAYALIDNSYRQYKNKVKELYGEETHNNIIDAIAKEECKDVHISAGGLVSNYIQEIDEDSDPRLFYDEYSGRYFESTIEKVLLAEYHLNRNYILRGFARLNEFYEFLGLEPTDYGEAVGWDVCGEIYWIDFNHRKTVINIGDADDEIECYIIEMPYYPRRGLHGSVRRLKSRYLQAILRKEMNAYEKLKN